MPQEKDVLYGVGYTETEPEPGDIDPATYRRDFDLARQIIRDAVPPGKQAKKSDLIKLIRGWRKDKSELAPLIAMKKQINALNDQISEETDPAIISELESRISDIQMRFNSARPPDFITEKAKTIKRLRRGMSIAGPTRWRR